VIESFPDTPTDESPVQAEIRAAWEEYNRVKDKFARDPELNDLTEIQYVTTGQEATDAVKESCSYVRQPDAQRHCDLP
jgi:hypothetical protein